MKIYPCEWNVKKEQEEKRNNDDVPFNVQRSSNDSVNNLLF